MVLGVQIIGIGFTLITIYLTFLYYKRKDLNAIELVIWFILWFGFLFLILFPHIIDNIIKDLNIVRALDLFTISAIIILLGIVFYLYILVRRNDKRTAEVVRKIALDEFNKRK